MNSVFGRRLENLRESKGWSKTQVAKYLGISTMGTYANYEYGRREPDFEMVKKIAKLYGVSTDYLIGNDDDKSSDPKEIDLDSNDPVVLSYGGKPVSDEDMEIIKAILARHQKKGGQ